MAADRIRKFEAFTWLSAGLSNR